MFRNYSGNKDPKFTGDILELDLGSVKSCISGPKRPHDRIPVNHMK